MSTYGIYRIMADTHVLLYSDSNLKGPAMHAKMAGASYKHVNLHISSRDQTGKSFIKAPWASVFFFKEETNSS